MGSETNRRQRDKSALVTSWSDKDHLNGDIVTAFTAIMRTQGCRWHNQRGGGCTMCGYNQESSKSITPEHLRVQFEEMKERYKGEDIVKLYTSGSFLDECEIDDALAAEIADYFSKRAKMLVVESRPEFITDEKLKKFKAGKATVAMGLESSNQHVLGGIIRKGIGLGSVTDAAKKLTKHKIGVKSYVLCKPPMLTEARSIEDSLATISFAAQFSDVISLNPVNVQKGTVLERLYERGLYRPPWLWSVLDVLAKSSAKHKGKTILCQPAGAGSKRGAHNCRECDTQIINSIREYSLSQDASKLEGNDCNCKVQYETELDLEPFALGPGTL